MAKVKKNRNTHNKRGGKGKKSAAPKKLEPQLVDGFIVYEDGITVNDLAAKVGQQPAAVIKILFLLGIMVTINTTLSDEQVELICLEYGFECKKEVKVDENNFEEFIEEDNEEDLVPRCPVVTIMGHVDHGKTTLLDTIRKTAVAEGEAGGITQHIGAYQVEVEGKKITFLDTPGHEAFTAMRARGAQVTDIVIIVVAADDGVMPQTKEAIDHAKAAGVPIVVAVNKIDKEGADVDRIKGEMSEEGLMPEDWGGDTVYCEISAKMNIGIEDLLETLTVVAELQDYKANPKRLAYGTVIEGRLDKGRGPVVTLLVENGTLKSGDPIVVGTTFGRVRQMVDDRGKIIKTALPGTPVEITGLNDVPVAGDRFKAFDSEKKARSIGETRLKAKQEEQRGTNTAMSLDDLYSQIKEGEIIDLNIIVKADVQGTAEAVKASLNKINVEGVRVNVIRSTVGSITESDVLLASASKALIYGFNVRPNSKVRQKAEEEGVEIHLHNIIYKMIEEIEAAMTGMLAPEFREKVTGQAEIRQVIKVSKVGNVAGCYVTEGTLFRNSGVRLIRDGIVIYEGKLGSLRRFTDDVKQVNSGFECGLSIENYNDIKEGDVVEGYVMEEVER